MVRLVVIPARGGSKRIPHKNIKPFLGRPIISYAIETAKELDIEEVMVSTEDPEIAKVALEYGAKVPFMRSTKNSSDTADIVDVLLEVLGEYKNRGMEFDEVVCIFPTAIFATAENIFTSLNHLQTSEGSLPIVKYSYPPQRGLKINAKGKMEMIDLSTYKKRTQDIDPIYHDAGQYYCLRVKELLDQKTLYPKVTNFVLMFESEVQDIDNADDWKIAKMKYLLKFD